MPKEIMERRASDNVYLHRDFHGALSEGLEYLGNEYGDKAVIEYLDSFAKSYYHPLIERIRTAGLAALEEHFSALYRKEGGDIAIICGENELVLTVKSCPAVSHMRKSGYTVSGRFIETERTVNGTIARESGLDYELVHYDSETGASEQCFRRKS